MAAKAHKRRRSSGRPRKNFWGTGMLANKPRKHHRRRSAANNPHRRRKTYRHNKVTRYTRRRTYRRNPDGATKSFMGISLPPMDAVLFTGAGFIVPPIISSMVMGYIPAAWQTSAATKWVVNIASVVGPSMLVKKFVNPRAGNLMLIGGGVWLAMEAIKTFAPGIIPGLGYQPFLGKYTRTPGMGEYNMRRLGAAPDPNNSMRNYQQLTPILQNTPSRLSPQSRF